MPTINSHTQPIGVDYYKGEAQLPLLNDLQRNVYYLRVIADDQSIYRSAPISVLTEDFHTQQEVYIWDEALEKSKRVTVNASEIIDLTWDFDQPQERIVSGGKGSDFDWELGGQFIRDGRFNPDQQPQYVKGHKGSALRFDGMDVAINSPQLIPLGAWAMGVWIKPERLDTTPRQVLFKVPETLQITIEPDRKIRVWFGDRKSHVILQSTTQLQQDRWCRLELAYDLSRVILRLDGKPESRARWQGYRDRIAQQSYLGANISSKHMQPPSEGFIGLMDELHLTNRADRITELISHTPND